jgi:hypothetical protein
VSQEREKPTGSLRRAAAWCRRNPIVVVVFVGGAAAGAGLTVGLEIGPAGMPVWKRALGGALAGAWFGMFPLGFRLFE